MAEQQIEKKRKNMHIEIKKIKVIQLQNRHFVCTRKGE